MRRAWRIVLAGMILAAGCTHRVSDTGYVGTWERGNERARSAISIWKEGDGYRFYWKLVSTKGNWTVTCDKTSHCVETLDGKKVAEYQFTTRVDAASGHLLVECERKQYLPKDLNEHTVDELVVEEKGLKLGSYVIDQNGAKWKLGEGPKRSYDKVSNYLMEIGK